MPAPQPTFPFHPRRVQLCSMGLVILTVPLSFVLGRCWGTGKCPQGLIPPFCFNEQMIVLRDLLGEQPRGFAISPIRRIATGYNDLGFRAENTRNLRYWIKST